jgi:MtN3 and saliva related transmembrane protein
MVLPWIGALAAVLTSLSYLPTSWKGMAESSTSDLSLKILVALTPGLSLWVCYGLVKGDRIIVLANGVGLALSFSVLWCKVRDLGAKPRRES